jgi:hypothetical protein
MSVKTPVLTHLKRSAVTPYMRHYIGSIVQTAITTAGDLPLLIMMLQNVPSAKRSAIKIRDTYIMYGTPTWVKPYLQLVDCFYLNKILIKS